MTSTGKNREGKHSSSDFVKEEVDFMEAWSTVESLPSGSTNLRDSFSEGNNLLLHGDNATAMQFLSEKGFENTVDLIYMDPPFFSNALYRLKNGTAPGETTVFSDFRNSQRETYLDFMRERLILARRLLSPTGSIYVHLDWHVAHFVKILMDQIFGPENFRNEIIWHYYLGGKSRNFFGRKHDTIFFYSKSGEWKFNPVTVKRRLDYVPSLPARSSSGKKIEDTTGKDEAGWYSNVAADDVWEISGVFNLSNEYTGFPTQKPLALLKRIVLASTDPGDTVADFFSGSGTTLMAAQLLGRQWIGCDTSGIAVNITTQRLLSKSRCSENNENGGQTFHSITRLVQPGADPGRSSHEQYVESIIAALSADPVKEYSPFHGSRNGELIYVADPSEPVSLELISRLDDEVLNSSFSGGYLVAPRWMTYRDNEFVHRINVKSSRIIPVLSQPLRIMPEVLEQPSARSNQGQEFFRILDLGIHENPPEEYVSVERFRLTGVFGTGKDQIRNVTEKDITAWFIAPRCEGDYYATYCDTRMFRKPGKDGGARLDTGSPSCFRKASSRILFGAASRMELVHGN